MPKKKEGKNSKHNNYSNVIEKIVIVQFQKIKPFVYHKKKLIKFNNQISNNLQ